MLTKVYIYAADTEKLIRVEDYSLNMEQSIIAAYEQKSKGNWMTWTYPKTMEGIKKHFPDKHIHCFRFYLEDTEHGFIYQTIKTARDLWADFSDVPINNDDEIEENFLDFPKGTDRFEILRWFEDTFSVSVHDDLMEVET